VTLVLAPAAVDGEVNFLVNFKFSANRLLYFFISWEMIRNPGNTLMIMM